MLKSAVIKANTILATLSEEQITAIETLSENDENAVISKKVGEIHGQYDRDIEEVTGISKPDGVKTYAWMKTDILTKVKASQGLETQISTLKTEKTELEDKIKSGDVDGVLKQKLADEENRVLELRDKLKADEESHTLALKTAQDQNDSILIAQEFSQGMIGMKFKDEKIIPKEVRESFIKNAQSTILSESTPSWVDNGQGGKRLVFLDENGVVRNNKENGLFPFTAKDLLTQKLSSIIDNGQQQRGAGTGNKGGQTSTVLDLSTAKTQVEADEMASKHLFDKGVTRGTEEFNTKLTEIRAENKVSELPLS